MEREGGGSGEGWRRMVDDILTLKGDGVGGGHGTGLVDSVGGYFRAGEGI